LSWSNVWILKVWPIDWCIERCKRLLWLGLLLCVQVASSIRLRRNYFTIPFVILRWNNIPVIRVGITWTHVWFVSVWPIDWCIERCKSLLWLGLLLGVQVLFSIRYRSNIWARRSISYGRHNVNIVGGGSLSLSNVLLRSVVCLFSVVFLGHRC